MGDKKDLFEKEGTEKMREMAEDITTCMFCTSSGAFPFSARPMATQEVDEEGNFWFLSGAESDKNHEIENNSQVQLIYGQPNESKFLVVYGTAEVTKDKDKIDALWTPFAKAWFTEGKDDPRLTVICVKPQFAHYWDTKHGRMVSLVGIAVSAMTGKTMDNGVEGAIKV